MDDLLKFDRPSGFNRENLNLYSPSGPEEMKAGNYLWRQVFI